MLFPTPEYAFFFLIVFAAAWTVRRFASGHKALLLCASYAFYAFWDWRFLPLLVGISLVGAVVGRRLQVEQRPRARMAWLVSGLSLCLGALGVFKYLGFAAATVVGLLQAVGLHPGTASLPEIALPVGVSFFVFHAISLMVDAFQERIPVKVTLLDALLYVAFFPQLVAGPILRASTFLPQLARAPDPSAVDAARAMELFVIGLVKKVLLASFLASRLVDPVFAAPSAHPGLESLLGVYGYAAQIYCDFSGYTDMAIGSALLLGYRFPENFNAPYRAASPADFWYRWHISLSSWLRDYLFMPLCADRPSKVRRLWALCLTMVLGGLWHGAAWTFVCWGLFHGVGLVVHRLWSGSRAAVVKRVRAWALWPSVATILTFHFVCLGWVLFRAPSLDSALELLAALFHPWTVGPWLSAATLIAIGLGVFGPLFPSRLRLGLRTRLAQLPLPVQGLALALVVLAIEAAGPKGVSPFIYFQF